MAYVVGIDEFFKFSTSVGGGRTGTGIISGGTMAESSEVRDIRSIGDFKPTQLREGLLTAFGNVTLELQDKTLLELGKRNASTGRLTEFDIEGGGSSSESQVHKNCKIDSLTIDAAAGAELRGSVAWKALYSADGSGGTHSPANDPVLMWYNGVISGISSIELVGATISIAHNVDWGPVIDSSLSAPVRRAKYLVEKNQVISCSLRFLEQEGIDLMVESLTVIGSVVLTFDSAGAGTNSIKITLTNLKRGAHERPLTPADLIEYGANYAVEDWDIGTA